MFQHAFRARHIVAVPTAPPQPQRTVGTAPPTDFDGSGPRRSLTRRSYAPLGPRGYRRNGHVAVPTAPAGLPRSVGTATLKEIPPATFKEDPHFEGERHTSNAQQRTAARSPSASPSSSAQPCGPDPKTCSSAQPSGPGFVHAGTCKKHAGTCKPTQHLEHKKLQTG